MKILVIEDDEKTAAYLKKGLMEEGFIVDVSHDGVEGLALAAAAAYDLIILDILLPRRDGWSVLCELRRAGNPTPALVLSALGAVPEKVRALSSGADDYLVKPFAFPELLARVQSVLRRGPTRQSQAIRISDLQIDPVKHRANRNGTRLDLTPKEYLLLSLLARHPGEVFSRTMIASRIWDMNFDAGTNVVDVHIRRLRSKVDDPFEKKLIHTIRGLGYVLEDQ